MQIKYSVQQFFYGIYSPSLTIIIGLAYPWINHNIFIISSSFIKVCKSGEKQIVSA